MLPLEAPVSPDNTAAEVAALERKVAAEPDDAEALVQLGLAYQQRARETADPTYYPRSEAALRRGLRLGGDRLTIFTGLASLAASRHRFEDALAFARHAQRLAPVNATVDAVLGDASVELGRYRQAFAAFDRMARLKPSLAAYVRVAYARELLGRPAGGIDAMRMAVAAGSGNAENTAWTLTQLGTLEFDTGHVEAATRAYRQALERLPGYVHALAGLGRVDAARGELLRAASFYRRAVAKVPLPQYVIALGDVEHAAGREGAARRAYALVGAIERLFRANGVRTELETALFDLDHHRDVRSALTRARAAFIAAPSINAEDVLAWALYRNGNCVAAERHSSRALRLGTRDALKLFHRGMIERCLGHAGASRAFLDEALAINPHFSLLYAPTARRLAR